MAQNSVRKAQNGTECHKIGTEWHIMIYIDKNKAQNGTEQTENGTK